MRSTASNPTSSWSILILPSLLRLGLPCVFFPPRSPYQSPVRFSHVSLTCYVPCPSLSWFDQPINFWWGVQIIKLLLCSFLYSAITSPLLGPISSPTPVRECPQPIFFIPQKRDQVSHPCKTTSKIIVLFIFIFLDCKLEDKRFYTYWKFALHISVLLRT